MRDFASNYILLIPITGIEIIEAEARAKIGIEYHSSDSNRHRAQRDEKFVSKKNSLHKKYKREGIKYDSPDLSRASSINKNTVFDFYECDETRPERALRAGSFKKRSQYIRKIPSRRCANSRANRSRCHPDYMENNLFTSFFKKRKTTCSKRNSYSRFYCSLASLPDFKNFQLSSFVEFSDLN